MLASRVHADSLVESAVWHVRVEGEQDLSTEGLLESALARVVDRGCRVVVDLSHSTFIDSAIIDIIVSSWAEAERLGGRMVVCADDDCPCRRILDLLRLPGSFASYRELPDAIAALDEPFASASEPDVTRRLWDPPGSPRL